MLHVGDFSLASNFCHWPTNQFRGENTVLSFIKCITMCYLLALKIPIPNNVRVTKKNGEYEEGENPSGWKGTVGFVE
jgi:hypothetical protein